MSTDQPTYVMRMTAKPETGDAVFEKTTEYIQLTAASDPWIKFRQRDEPGNLWTFEFFKSDEIKGAYETGPQAAELRPQVLSLVSSAMRHPVHPYSASWIGADTGYHARQGQPGLIVHLVAAEGDEDALADAATAYFRESGICDNWTICRVDENPAELWAYALSPEGDSTSFEATLRADFDALQPGLLAGAPEWVPVTTYSAAARQPAVA